jgi:hypothetical protein
MSFAVAATILSENYWPQTGQGETRMNPNSVRSAIRVALGALSLGILTACGGGSVGVGDQTLADGGIRGTGSSVGPVSGFGSVFVNGIKFETGGARFVIDDSVSNQSEDSLQKGMILRIEGEWRDDGTGDAEVVEYDDTFRGKVTNFTGLDLEGAGDFEILGQTITITPQTVIRLKAGAIDLQPNDFVRVSAWRDGLGYRASLVEVIAESPEVEIEGPASPAGASTNTFSINGQLISYSETTFQNSELTEKELEDLISGGQFVEVEGSLDIPGEISANKVGLADDRRFRGTNGEDIEITGPVNDFTGGDTFSINGIPVDILDDTRFDDLVLADLVDGLLVEVEGDVIDGVVQAEEISLRESNAEVKGAINSPDPDAQTFSVGGVLVRVTSQTLITDDEDTIITREVDFNKLTAGTNVEVEGLESRDEQNAAFIEALKIEFENQNEFELEGKLQSVSQTGTLIGTTISVLDVTIALTVDTEFENDGLTFQELEAHVGELIEVEYECADLLGQGCTAVSIDLD